MSRGYRSVFDIINEDKPEGMDRLKEVEPDNIFIESGNP